MAVPQAYTILNIFKRLEVWVLLILTATGLVFVLVSRGDREAGDPGSDPPPPRAAADKVAGQPSPPPGQAGFETSGPIAISGVTVRRDREEFLAEIRFSYDNQSDAMIDTLDAAKLVTGSGKSLPVFFLAFTGAPPQLPAKAQSDASLQFSLRGEDLVGELTLVIADQRSPVKSARSFDPESIRDQAAITFNLLDW